MPFLQVLEEVTRGEEVLRVGLRAQRELCAFRMQ